MSSHSSGSREKLLLMQDTDRYDALKFRQTLNKSVINMFADLSKLTIDPENAAVLTNFYKFIKCFRHCLEEFPQIFVICSSSDAMDQGEGNSVALVFTEWLMMRLLNVLSTPYPTAIHEGCEGIFVSLLQVVRTMDPPNFRRFCLRLLSLMSELNSLYEDFSNNGGRKLLIEKYFSETNIHLKGDEGLDLTYISIEISDPLSCERFQIKLTMLMGKLLTDFVLVVPDHYNTYWKVLCLQIEIGSLDLKKVSLNTIQHSTQIEGLPATDIQINYILDCLQSLVVFCCSQDLPEISDSFENAVASCLVTVTKAVESNKNFIKTNHFIIIRILENILQVVTSFGFVKLKCESFPSAIIEAIASLLKSLDDLSLLSSSVVHGFQVSICNFLKAGETLCPEFLNPLFVFFVTTEVSKLTEGEESSERMKNVLTLSTFSNSPRTQILKLIGSVPANDLQNIRFPAYFNIKSIPFVWPSISEILLSSLKNLESTNASEISIISHVKIVTCCLNILLQSSLKLQSKDRSTNFLPVNSSHPDEINALLPNEVLHAISYNVLALWSTYYNSLPNLFQELVGLCSCIICFQDFLLLTSDNYSHLCQFLSCPWISSSSSDKYLDLRLDNTICIPSSHPHHLISTEVMSKCIQCLSHLPHDVSPLWRCFVIKSCYESDNNAAKIAAIKALPMFFHAGVIPQADIWKIHKNNFQDDSFDVQIEISKIIGRLNCILHSICSLYRVHNSNEPVTLFPEVFCNVCNIGKPFKKSKRRSSSSLKYWLLNTFMHSIQHSNSEVRKASITAIQSFFAHNPYDEPLLCTIVQLVIDPDSKVRRKFSSVVQYILKPFYEKTTTKVWTPDMDEILMSKVREGLNFAKTSRNLRLQESILSTICEIGKVASNGLLLICVINLLENLLSSAPSIVTVARFKMQEIALAKKFKMSDLFRAYREPICKFIAESLMTIGGDDSSKALNMIEEIYVVFGYGDVKSFLNVTQQYILPYLVSKENDHTPALLSLLAKSLDTHKRGLLMNNFPFIFSYLVRQNEKVELEKALHCVQKETGLEFGSLLRCNYQHIHNELLLHISTHYNQVFAGLATLALKSEDQKEKRCILTRNEDMANYLQPKLLGFLVFFDSQLLKSNVTLDDKKLALQSLISIMQLMGPRHITTVRFKIMATLRIALRFKEDGFPRICCRAWEVFVQSIEMASLGPLINQVAVALLPLLDVEPEEVSRILHFLIIENKSSLKEFFHDLYFIPDIPQLQEINEILKEYTEDHASQSDFETVLSHSLRGVSHENLDVRMHAFAKLKEVLHSNQLSLHEHLLGKESVDHLLSNLISAIMPVCRESDIKARTLLAECLGALGAIDPGRLELKNTNGEKGMYGFLSSVEDENFAFALLQELAHSFLAAADCRIQDCSAFAIQEALRIYKFLDRKQASGHSNNLWKRFPPDIQEILDVLSNSQYKPLEKKKRVFPKPIYQSSVGNTFINWVTNWFSDLITKVKHGMAAKLFHSCSMISKYDLNCALFLLPHVVVYALIDSNEADSEGIVKEVLAVLEHCELSLSTSDLCQLSCQTIFSIFDHLAKWIRYRQRMLNSDAPQRASSSKAALDPGFRAANAFLSKIPQLLLAKSSFNCHAYTRALMHLEQYLNDNPSELVTNISFLQKLYAALDESDGVAGVSAIRIEDAILNDAILEHEATGDMQGAFACYEKAINIFPNDVSYYGGLLKCFIRMDQPSTALSYANGIIVNQPEWEKDLNSYRVEAAWKLASWNSLELFLKNETPSDKWNVSVGEILLNANNEDSENFEEQIKAVRCSQMAPLSAASMENGAYLRGYDHLTRLHMLTDIQQSLKAFWSLQNSNLQERITLVDQVISKWKIRQQLVQSSLRHQEPIFDLHRVVLKMGKVKYPELSEKFDQEIASAWLKSAKLARKSGHQQRAYSCLLEAGTINSPALFMEKTKWHWNKSDHDQAILCLQKGIKDHFSACLKDTAKSQGLSNETLLMYAKAKLLLAVYSEESAIADSNRLIQMYREIVTLQPQWEESHFHLAKYYDKMLPAIEDEKTKSEVMIHICRSFGASLRYGCKHVYHSLPRLLDIWFDMGSQVAELQMQKAKKNQNQDRNMEVALSQLTTIVIPELNERLPVFLFMTAFPQMVSRICHSHADVSQLLQKIIAKVLVAHSQQAIWMMIAVSKSSYPMRVQRCKKIFQEAVLLKPELSKFIQDTMKLSDKLLELSNKIVKESTLSIREYFQILPRMVEDRNFSDVMLPLQTQMIVTLPSGFSSRISHNPFPFTPICIRGFQDTVEIFSSLQRPKKLIIKGSDGKQYGIICKPKDDLRKDCRLMEFNNLVNRYLKSDPEARKRQLYIRTYAVVPLNEECGLIEWVPNLTGLRLILTRIYKIQGLYVTGREIKAMMPHRTASVEQKISIFTTKFLPKFPPVFRQWFLSTFPDPTAWYLARLAYARTAAVMSMVGYIVGLGDRHGENILFDSSCGDIVHVDLNCLFNKGETMECPECVPFRLTHNMVDAMGPTGYEGVFRKSCEVTMKIMRNRTDALMSVLRPFIHDPLVEWSRTSKATRSHPLTAGELTNEMGLTHVKDIELRLKGIIKAKNKPQGLPLSIEGQVNYLIQEATDLRNLSQMYIGWTPYL